jgi:hypothetical protein
MMRALVASLAIGASLVVACVAPAAAAPKKPTKTAPSAIDISNQRTVELKSFTLSTTGAKPKVVGKLAKPLAAGARSSFKLAAKGCEYTARWEFEDAGDEGLVNLCNDPKIVLTD